MRTTNFDAVAAAAPLNREASTVRDGSGDLWEPRIKPTQAHWKAPPKPEGKLPAGKEDLTGRKCGRMSVVGYHSNGKSGSRWLVRCSCGDYELRRSRAIRDADPDHCCAGCQVLKSMLHHASARKPTLAARKAEEAMLDRFASPKVCGACKSPFTCEALEKCVQFHGESA